jgi:hypothetical protein
LSSLHAHQWWRQNHETPMLSQNNSVVKYPKYSVKCCFITKKTLWYVLAGRDPGVNASSLPRSPPRRRMQAHHA